MSAETSTPQHAAVFVRADDGRVVGRLREVVRRRLHITLFAGSEDPRAGRLATAVDAELGAIAPDAHLPVVLCPKGPPRDGIVGSQTLVVPSPDDDGWRVLYPDGGVGIALDGAATDALDEAVSAGAELGPVGSAPVHAPVDLTGIHAIHVASVPGTIADERLPSTVAAVRAAGVAVEVRTVADTPSRRTRIREGWRLVREARHDEPDVVHVHDPELLPAAYGLAVRHRCTVVYDVHADLRAAARSRQWIPRPVRRPFAAMAGRIENLIAARLAAVLADSRLAAIDFAARGANAIGVDDPTRESAKIVALYGRLTGRSI